MFIQALQRGAIKRSSRARSTKVEIVLIDNRDGKWCDGGAPWELACVDHGGSLGSHSRRHATSFMSAPEQWCDECQAIYKKTI